ncbi:VOC family protein [Vibrio tapetis subsp. quintayensis]|uniref:VOC family protein n=1 Tax=Vibrio tapetis TaxID=52443 RepID=UPI0025B32F47|nr:VOC family protein [Vibrio tapetis]MDN3680866.1 VOC family protein [Vibrio tapetis subsp. quintayensis]
MIKLEHVNIVVKDIPEMLKFYQAVFPHWYVRDEGQGEWYGKPRNWLHFGDEYQYIALSDHGEGENRELSGHQVGLAHFAYVTNDIQSVIDRLTHVGFSVAKTGATEPYRKNVYFVDPSGFEVEFVEYLSDDPKLRNLSS